MRAGDPSERLARTWRGLSGGQRAAASGAVGLIVSTVGPFSWVEAAEIVAALAVLAMLERRSSGAAFSLPLGDGGALALAGGWCAVLVLVRSFDRSLTQTAIGLACGAVLAVAGARARSSGRLQRPPAARP